MKRQLHYIAISIYLLIFSFSVSFAHNSSRDSTVNSTGIEKKIKVGAIPNLSFNSDVGFRYGVLANLNLQSNDYTYNKRLHSFFFEWSRTTHGNGINRIWFKSNRLFPDLNFNLDISYITDLEMQFFGFNGYESVYNSKWEDPNSTKYKSDLFYRHDRKLFRIVVNFQGKLFDRIESLQWFAGLTYLDYSISPVDIDRINKYRSDDDEIQPFESLYDKYVSWGIINRRDALGDNKTLLKGGIIYDTRDHEGFTSNGIFSELILSYAPSLPGDGRTDYGKATFFWRHYLSISQNIVFAYRLGLQTTLFGEVPFYIQPYIITSDISPALFEGLGGSKSLRGVMRNRVVGDGFALGNAEIRWKFLCTNVFNQDLYFGLNLFADIGQITNKIEIKIDESEVNEDDNLEDYFDFGNERLHVTSGAGLKMGLNNDLIISLDYGIASDKRDGNSGIYMTLNWSF